MEQPGVSDVFSNSQYLYQQIRTLNSQTYQSTETIFYNIECSKLITHTELLKFINMRPNKYKIFLYNFEYNGIDLDILSFDHIISNTSHNDESQIYNYYNCYSKYIYYTDDDGFEAGLSPNIITRELTYINEPKFYHDISDFGGADENLIRSFNEIMDTS